MFEPLPAQFSFPEAEQRILEFWEQHNIFQKSLDQRRAAPRFVFYEGPPTANGMPHPGHCLTRSIKDLFPRYQTMCGKLVDRNAGWDTHGLPVEVEVCKELGIHTKQEIEAYGVEKFVRLCIESVFRYTREWEQMTKRLGFWVNLEDAYVTFHQSYVESVWWSLKTLFDRGLLYQGHKVVWWWAQGGTALSAGEVGEGYRTVRDPSVYVRFRLLSEPGAQAKTQGTEARRHEGTKAEGDAPVGNSDRLPSRWSTLDRDMRGTLDDDAPSEPPHAKLPPDSKISLLVWTTTPWTLISNHFAAVGPDVDYSLVHDNIVGEYYYIATALVSPTAEKLKHPLIEVGTCKGRVLVDSKYQPPFDAFAEYDPSQNRVDDLTRDESFSLARWVWSDGKKLRDVTVQCKDGKRRPVAWRVVPADFIDLKTGTGIVHIAPAYGEDDFDLLQRLRDQVAEAEVSWPWLPLLNAVLPNGDFGAIAGKRYEGRWVKACDKEIMQELKGRGVLLHQETIEHEYPFCPRAEDDPLIQYARKSWFVRTSQFKEEFLKNNDNIHWLPEHIQEGRFGDFLRNNVDWALSRERYWGTPLPIWVCEQTGKMEAIGSYAELLAKPGVQGLDVWEQAKKADPALPDHLKVHKPYIDAVTYDSPFAPGGRDVPGGVAVEGGVGVPPARMHRVPEVIDCWWDAGSMPFAQWGYPHAPASVETFAGRFPADFISEAIDQTRGWFYGLLAISTLLFREGGVGVPGGVGVSPVPFEKGGVGVSPMPFEKGGVGVSPATAATGVTRELSLRKRRKLPHWEAGSSTYFVTFRTGTKPSGGGLVELTPEERTLALNACRHWDGKRMLLHAVVVMPDHVHMLFTPVEKTAGVWWSLSELLHSIKGFSAKEINARRSQMHSVDGAGTVWQDERYDRIIRNEADFAEKWSYIVTNPQRTGMEETYPWLWVEPSHAEGGQDAHPTLPYPHPFKTCIVLGHVMGEDGLKMSKRTKNYKEPSYIFDSYGADAMRWFFFSAQPPWTSVRFQEANIRDAQREFLVRLYNVFSFFNIYANIDGFHARHEGTELRPTEEGGRRRHEDRDEAQSKIKNPKSKIATTGWNPVPQRSELDRWIISELNRTIRDVRAAMDRFENFPAAGRIKDFVDALSNWYVRRSRERFWRPVAAGGSTGGETDYKPAPQDQDKWDAYNTLYECLLTLSQLIAPFTPFFAETMYQNLAGTPAADSEAAPLRASFALPPRSASASSLRALSVHLCDYPQADESLIDESLVQEMDLVRDIVSLGRAARTAAKLKVRQPLDLVEIILTRREHAHWLEVHSDLIAEELNIKRVEFSTEAEQYVTYQVKPDFKAIGPKFGKLAPQVAAALAKLDATAARKSLTETGRVTIDLPDGPAHLTEQEVAVRLEAKPGWSAAQGRGGVVVVKTELTDELRDEGFCRELIHQVQALRKARNLPYEARISLYAEGADEVLDILRHFANVVESECLAPTIKTEPPPAGAEVWTGKIEGHAATLGIVEA